MTGLDFALMRTSERPWHSGRVPADMEHTLHVRMAQQAAVAQLGVFALNAPLDEIMNVALAAVRETLAVDLTSLTELIQDGQAMVVRDCSGWENQNSWPMPLNPKAISTRALQRDTAVVVEDYANSDMDPPPTERHHGVRSGISVPIRCDGGHFGVIAGFAVKPRVFSHDDVHFVESVGNIIGTAVDRERSRAALAEREALYRTIADRSLEGISMIDLEGRYTYVNHRQCEMLGYSQEELLRMTVFDVMTPQARDQARRGVLVVPYPAALVKDVSMVRKDGSSLWVKLSSAPLYRNGERVGAMAMISDISERKRAEDALEHQALHDALTGLPNRVLLRDRLQQASLGSLRQGLHGALLMMDLDRFKEVNDTFGHQCGDELLQQVAQRLQRAVRKADTVARLGGDEFAILLPGCQRAKDACATARKLLQAIAEPTPVQGHELGAEASIGVAMFPEHGHDAETLLRHSDIAMYEAKRRQIGVALFANAQDGEMAARLDMVRDVRAAIAQRQIELAYQPKIELRSGALVGVEALARWDRPGHGPVPPEAFVPIIEENGLAQAFTPLILEAACRQLARWRRDGLDISLAVNISVRNLGDHGFVETVLQIVNDCGVPATSIILELTESGVLGGDRHVQELQTLVERGLRLSIDDFGTGYSSLSSLRRLRVHEIKIDQSFVQGMVRDVNDLAIVQCTIQLAHTLKLDVVAEGVEDAGTLGRLRELGCDVVQGFYTGVPMAAEQLVTWMGDRGRTPD